MVFAFLLAISAGLIYPLLTRQVFKSAFARTR
jgi:hypothetical protein